MNRVYAQALSIPVIIATLALLWIWYRRHRVYGLSVVPAFVWLFHGLIYYIATLYAALVDLPPTPGLLFTTWGSIVRLHGYLTTLACSIALNLIFDRKGRSRWKL